MALVKFYSVEDYIVNQAKPNQYLLEQVRQLIVLNFPMLTEKISFNCPFYHYKGMFCYLGIEKKRGVKVGFCNGKYLDNSSNLLIGQDRKHVRLFLFADLTEKTKANFLQIMHEALILQEERAKQKQKMRSEAKK